MKNAPRALRAYLLLGGLGLALQPLRGVAQSKPDAARADLQQTPARDGQHDFDFEIGTWNTHLSRLGIV